jgi:hypothetical protein
MTDFPNFTSSDTRWADAQREFIITQGAFLLKPVKYQAALSDTDETRRVERSSRR